MKIGELMTEENTEAEIKVDIDNVEPEIEINQSIDDLNDEAPEKEKTYSAVEFEEANSKYMRLVAEFDNFRRRTAKEHLDLIESANHKLLGNLCEVVENFERAYTQSDESIKIEDYKNGIRLIQEQLMTILKSFGLESIEPLNEAFDPNFHEALMQQPSDEVDEDKVLSVFQKGFKVKNKVIQHAKVIVSSGPVAE
jgi:molecular chaperone GrpE